MKKRTMQLCRAALIAALYIALTYLSSAIGLASGPVQIRFSEALCILPAFSFSAVPGLTLGCLVANLLYGNILEVIFGSLATLVGALGSYFIGKTHYKWLALLPPIVANTLIIPFIYIGDTGFASGFWLIALGTLLCEMISVGLLGGLLIPVLEKYKTKLF